MGGGGGGGGGGVCVGGGFPCPVIHPTRQRQGLQQESSLAEALSEKHCGSAEKITTPRNA